MAEFESLVWQLVIQSIIKFQPGRLENNGVARGIFLRPGASLPWVLGVHSTPSNVFWGLEAESGSLGWRSDRWGMIATGSLACATQQGAFYFRQLSLPVTLLPLLFVQITHYTLEPSYGIPSLVIQFFQLFPLDTKLTFAKDKSGASAKATTWTTVTKEMPQKQKNRQIVSTFEWRFCPGWLLRLWWPAVARIHRNCLHHRRRHLPEEH